MTLRQAPLYCVLTVVWLCLVPTVATAVLAPLESGIFLGPLVAHVDLGVESVYETNVFHTRSRPFGDLSLITRPQMNVEYNRPGLVANVGGGMTDTRYFGLESSLTRNQSDVGWDLFSDYRQEFVTGTHIGTSLVFKDTSDPILAEITLDRQRLDRRRVEVETWARQLAGTGLVDMKLTYAVGVDRYQAGFDGLDRTSHGLTLESKLQTFPDLAFVGRAKYNFLIRPNPLPGTSSTSNQVQLLVGASGSLSPLYRVDILVGGAVRTFPNGQSAIGRPLAVLQLLYEPTELTDVRLKYQYISEDGSFTDEVVINKGGIGIERKLNDFLLSAQAEAWQTRFLPTTILDRSDVSIAAKTDLSYQPPDLELLKVRTGYHYLQRQASNRRNDFTDHRTYVRVDLHY